METWLKRRVGQWMLGANGVAEVIGINLVSVSITVGKGYVGTHVKQLAQLHGYLHVEVEKKLPLALEERP